MLSERITKISAAALLLAVSVSVSPPLWAGHAVPHERTGFQRPYAVPVLPEKVAFSSQDPKHDTTTLLDGYLFRPEGSGPFPAVVALHGCSGLFTPHGRLNARFADWGQRLSEEGYVVLFPDSFKPRGIAEACTRKDRSGFSPHKERPGDAYAALHWLQSQSYIRKDRIGLMGWSNGGITLLAAVASSFEKERSGDFRVAVAFYPGCTSFSRNQNWRPRIPLTILIGESDDWTPAAPCRSLVARVKGAGHDAEIVTFPNAYHDFDHPNLPVRTRKGLAFTVRKDGTATI